eukprot:CAMPEP_0197940802 /NCGR_PEP_ID=MMETSP1439-20131203/121810_1 /TAXON_ID=66791 /ORGANISM="Gonyaulax spinifera, Strain CCMP409" /LENGTH=125 /DNA_ID=CAMNT_0043563979 /DNA_START=93 /DNA_END=470 /DNA_ORIENTATION=-
MSRSEARRRREDQVAALRASGGWRVGGVATYAESGGAEDEPARSRSPRAAAEAERLAKNFAPVVQESPGEPVNAVEKARLMKEKEREKGRLKKLAREEAEKERAAQKEQAQKEKAQNKTEKVKRY